jgi:NAD+ kinase
MPTVAVITKPQKPELEGILRDLLEWLKSRGMGCVLDPQTADYLGKAAEQHRVVERAELAEAAPDLVISLGGDGTLLSAARAFSRVGTPIVAVNLGSLGFLTETPVSEMFETIEAWIEGKAYHDERPLMRCELMREGAMFRSWDALNDVVAAKGAIARMGEFSIELDGQFAARFRADGVIVSTPTGSTAYTLAANGPILVPALDAMVITAICPHLLTIRPIVVPGNSQVALRVEGIPHETYLTVDGQEAVELLLGDRIVCRRSTHRVHLVRLKPDGLFNVLRAKLSWGEQ